MTALDRLIAFLASVSADPITDAQAGLWVVLVAAVSVWLVAEAVGRT